MYTIYLTFKNADMTEGRGPMLPDVAFLHKLHADAYIDNKPGVMGFRRRWSETEFGDWRTEPVIVYETLDEYYEHDQRHAEEIRRTALRKLTLEERRVLGL